MHVSWNKFNTPSLILIMLRSQTSATATDTSQIFVQTFVEIQHN